MHYSVVQSAGGVDERANVSPTSVQERPNTATNRGTPETGEQDLHLRFIFKPDSGRVSREARPEPARVRQVRRRGRVVAPAIDDRDIHPPRRNRRLAVGETGARRSGGDAVGIDGHRSEAHAGAVDVDPHSGALNLVVTDLAADDAARAISGTGARLNAEHARPLGATVDRVARHHGHEHRHARRGRSSRSCRASAAAKAFCVFWMITLPSIRERAA